MSRIDCGEEFNGLSELPKFRRALAIWMEDFREKSSTILGPIRTSIYFASNPTAGRMLFVKLEADDAGEVFTDAAWFTDREATDSAERLAWEVLTDLDGALIALRMAIGIRIDSRE